MAAKLSVNINKYALLRNSRGHDTPNLLWAVDACVGAGAHGITVHPRRDQRHIRLDDVPRVAEHLRARHPGIEYNVECEDSPELIDLVLITRDAMARKNEQLKNARTRLSLARKRMQKMKGIIQYQRERILGSFIAQPSDGR